MALTQDLTFKPATELLGLMAAKELSPVELPASRPRHCCWRGPPVRSKQSG